MKNEFDGPLCACGQPAVQLGAEMCPECANANAQIALEWLKQRREPVGRNCNRVNHVCGGIMRAPTLHCFLITDADSRYRAEVRDSYSIIHRTGLYQNPLVTKVVLGTWIADNLGDFKLDWITVKVEYLQDEFKGTILNEHLVQAEISYE